MSMKVLRVDTHWEAGEAYRLLALIDELRAEIAAHYGNDIARMMREAIVCTDERQLELPFIDLPPF